MFTWVMAHAVGCELQRPAGAYEGGVVSPEQQRVTADIATEDTPVENNDVFSQFSGATGGTGLPTSDGGVATGTTGVATGTATTGGGAVADPLLAFEGDYYFKVVTVNRADGGSTLGTITTTATAYGQMRVVLVDGELVAEERLCHLDAAQTASSGAKVSTTLAPGVASKFREVYRTFTVTDNGFSTDMVRRRQGWRSDLVPDVMPTNPGDTSKFTDPDGDSVVGYRTTVSGTTSVGGLISGGRTCAYDVVSYSETAYEQGSFAADGSFGSAKIRAGESRLYALYATRVSGTGNCTTNDLNTASEGSTLSDEISFVRVAPLADYRACAPKTSYTSAL